MSNEIRLKRAYEQPGAGDGFRVLVDRLWPRGVSKEQVRIDLWLKEISPSSNLRKWFGHDAALWDEFRHRYFLELEEHPEPVAQLLEKLKTEAVTLVYAAKDQEHNNAVAIKEFIESGLARL
ncbi:MAG: DUF488 domain-containing protein [Sulfuricella sp.]|nr:DUF488 domain-containing protein [Sulfuricella sp.]